MGGEAESSQIIRVALFELLALLPTHWMTQDVRHPDLLRLVRVARGLCIAGRPSWSTGRLATRAQAGHEHPDGFPLFPLFFWWIACEIDHEFSPWGTRIVGAGHVLFGAMLVVSIVRDSREVREIDRRT